METTFYKYQATGNDFIIIDNREQIIDTSDIDLIKKISHRSFGIGGDGVILIENDPDYDFNMIFCNPDGSRSFCGNGSRCAAMFANYLGIIDDKTEFRAYDGPHSATITKDLVRLKMNDVHSVRLLADGIFVDTGSPHYIQFVSKAEQFNVLQEGKKIRYGGLFGTEGTNVNFVEMQGKDQIYVRTYERGVENETLSCGTGVTACAIAVKFKKYQSPVNVYTRGGKLTVEFKENSSDKFTNIYLSGGAEMIFKGRINLGKWMLNSNH